MQFHIENMTCGGCVRGVTRAIQSVDAGAQVEADLATHVVTVRTSAARAELEKALVAADFAPRAEVA